MIGEEISSRTFCGRSVPSKIMATSNALTVKFVSDDQGDGAGFIAEYSISSGSLFNSLKIINSKTDTLTNSEDPGKMTHNTALHLGLLCLPRQNQTSEKEI